MQVRAEVEGRPNIRAQAEQFPRATASALNKMAAQLFTRASREVRNEIRATKKGVDKSLFISKATPSRLLAILKSTGRRLNLLDMGARQNRKGVVVPTSVGKRWFYPHAFVANVKAGASGTHRAIFWKAKNAKSKWVRVNGRMRRTALPIKEISGPSIPHKLRAPRVVEALQTLIKVKLPELMAHEIDFFAGKK